MKIPRTYYNLMNMGLYPSEYAKYCPSEKRGEINFEGISRRFEGKYIAITGVIDKINPPLDMMNQHRVTCPLCTEHIYERVKVQVKEGGYTDYRYMEICPNCSELYYINDTKSIVDGINNSVIVVMEPTDEYYSAQHLVISNSNSYRKIDVVYLTSDELTKNDIGKTVTCKGILNFLDAKPLLKSDKIKIKDSSEKGVIEVEVPFERRDIPGYGEWREHILSRDKVCVVCGGDKNLHAHHLFGYKENPSLRVHTENGVAVCQWCHDKYHSYYGVKQINPVDFIKFVHRFGVK